VQKVTCPYCGGNAQFRPTSNSIYHGKDYGPVWVCWPCQAWVGCHPDTNAPLGRLADKELREWKIKTHAVFDPIWQNRLKIKAAIDPRYKQGMARGGRYKKLAIAMGIPVQECHIGMFDVERCKQAIEVCKSGVIDS